MSLPPGTKEAEARLLDAAEYMLEAHQENARILAFLVNELQGLIPGGKLAALAQCLKRARAAIAEATGEVKSMSLPPGTKEAEARLLDAAEDMLEALQATSNWLELHRIEDGKALFRQVEEAILKATGEVEP